MTKLDVGGGTLCAVGYENVDPRHGVGPFKRRIQDGLPDVADASIDAVRASHVLEHIPAGQERIDAFNEVWRVLKPGHCFEIIVPCIGYTDHDNGGGPVHAGWQGWSDPTHVSYWWYPESFWYFCNPAFQAHADYGKKMWEDAGMKLVDGWEAHVTFRKPL